MNFEKEAYALLKFKLKDRSMRIVQGTTINNNKSKQKERFKKIMQNIMRHEKLARSNKKEFLQRCINLPSIKRKCRRICSPTIINHHQIRTTSPKTSRKQKFLSIDRAQHTSNFINCTEEQAIINEKVRLRVLDARMSRFAGFKSPRILLRKLIESKSNNRDENIDIFDSSKTADIVHIKTKYEKFENIKLQNKELILSL